MNPQLISLSTRTALKTHDCFECGSDIKPGQRYERACWKDDEGSLVVVTRHLCGEGDCDPLI